MEVAEANSVGIVVFSHVALQDATIYANSGFAILFCLGCDTKPLNCIMAALNSTRGYMLAFLVDAIRFRMAVITAPVLPTDGGSVAVFGNGPQSIVSP